jgi:hypothetical protein
LNDWTETLLLDDSFIILKYNVFIDRAQNCINANKKIEQRFSRRFQTMFRKTMPKPKAASYCFGRYHIFVFIFSSAWRHNVDMIFHINRYDDTPFNMSKFHIWSAIELIWRFHSWLGQSETVRGWITINPKPRTTLFHKLSFRQKIWMSLTAFHINCSSRRGH